MKITTLLLTAAICGATAFAQEPTPDQLGRIQAQKERIQKILQAAENLQAAGMEREANQLREQARRQMEELEGKVRRDREPAGREQPQREGDREKPDRPQGDRERPDRERMQPEAPGGGGRALPPPDRPRADVAQLQAQLGELRATVRMLLERLERLEVAVRQAHPDAPRPGGDKPE